LSKSYSVKVGSKSYLVEVSELGGNRFRVVVNGKEFVIELAPHTAAPTQPPPAKPGEVAEVKEVGRVEGVGPQATPPGTEVVTAPVPGKVLKVLVNPGDVVSEKTALLTLESMKMELEIYATCSGKVKEVKVKPGDSVNVGEALVLIERA